MKILAVVVTHNRKELLSRCIHYIQAQELPPDDILVINNDSSDGTKDYLASNNINFITQENLGSAGGWHTGINYALDNNYDAVWLMDDDGFPDKQSLRSLANYLTDDHACLSSCVLNENNHNEFVFPMPVLNLKNNPTIRLWNRKIKSMNSIILSNSISYPFVHLFNGALIPIRAIKIIGNVNTNYFMMGDEVDYFFRLRAAGKVCTLLSARHYHPLVSERPYSHLKIYYLLKNSIILHKLYFDNPKLRNIGLVISLFYRVIKRNGVASLISFILNRNLFFKAVNNGRKGLIKKDFDYQN